MSKKIVSKIKGWEGSVTIADPLLLPQSLAIRKAMREIGGLGKKALIEEMLVLELPAYFKCIEEWDIKDRTQPTMETFPFAGTGESQLNSIEFVGFLRKEILALYSLDEADDPNP